MANNSSIVDYGSDPLGNGLFRMVPSGDEVNLQERNRRLQYQKRREVRNDCLGMSWEVIEAKQGGKLIRDL